MELNVLVPLLPQGIHFIHYHFIRTECCFMLVLNSLRPSDAYICVSKLTSIGSVNGLSPDRRQAIIWTNAGILLIEPLGTNFSEILIEILKVSFKKMRLKMSYGKRRPSCLGLNVLTHWGWDKIAILQNTFSNEWKVLYYYLIFTEVCSKGLIDRAAWV